VKKTIFFLSFLTIILTVNAQWVSNYSYRKKITTDNVKVCGPSDLTNFPVLISFTDANLKTVSNAGHVQNASGYDIIFTASDGTTLLSHQIEKYVSTTGEYIAWVKIPTLGTSVNTDIYMYYGNPLVSTSPSATGTWNATYGGVWHLHSDYADGTSNANNGTNSGSTNVAGKIGNCQSFNGTTDNIQMTNSASLTFAGNQTYSLEGWYKGTGDNAAILSMMDAASNYMGYDMWVEGGKPAAHLINSWSGNALKVNSTGSAINDNNWHHVVVTYSGSKTPAGMHIYVDGVNQTLSTANNNLVSNSTNPTVATRIGSRSSGASATSNLAGLIDEPRILNTELTSDWVCTQYNSENSPSTFYAVAAEENCTGVAVGGTATATDPAITSGNFTIIALAGYTGTIQWQKSTDGVIYADVAGQTASTLNTGVLAATSYYRAKVVNGGTCLAISTVATVTIIQPFLTCAKYRKQIDIDNTKVCGPIDLTDYTVLISVTDANLRSTANGGHVESANGYDIRFTDQDGATLFSYEIEKYDATTGLFIAWVKVPTLTTATNKTIFMYYGDASIVTDQSSTAAWNGNYKGVWHLNSVFSDRTSNANNGTNNGSTTATGKIGDARTFNGTTDNIQMANSASLTFLGNQTYTLEAWYKGVGNNAAIISMMDAAGGVYRGYDLYVESNKPASHLVNTWSSNALKMSSSGTITSDNSWHHIAVTYSGSMAPAGMHIYVDGVDQALTTSNNNLSTTITNPAVAFRIGSRSSGASAAQNISGAIDEVHVLGSVLSSDWVCTQYNNENSPSTFYSIGSESNQPGINGGTATALDNSLFDGENTDIILTNYTVSGASLQWQTSTDGVTYSNVVAATANSMNTGTLNTGVYYYRCKVDNGSCFGYSTVVTITITAEYLTGYVYRKKITIDKTKICGVSTLANFPILVSFIDPDLRTVANGGKVQNASGYDIDFTASDGTTILDHQVEKYVATTGEYVGWVRIPSISSAANKDIYMYYGNCSISTDQTDATTWNSNHKGIWHLHNSVFTDATSNANNGANNGSSNATGKIADCRSFNGTSDNIQITNSASLSFAGNQTYSIEAWYKGAGSNAAIVSMMDDASGYQGYDMYVEGAGVSGHLISSWSGDALKMTSTTAINDNSWHHIAITYSGSKTPAGMHIYVDGVNQTLSTANNNLTSNTTTPAVPTRIGSRSNGAGVAQTLPGAIDEVRILNIELTSDWVCSQYNSENSPSTFYSVGAEEGQIGWTGAVSTDWGTANNWSSCSVPAPGANIYIPVVGTARYPILDQNRTIGYLRILTGASATVSGYILTMNGDLFNDGAFTAATGTVSFSGSSQQSIKGLGSVAFYDFTLNNSASGFASILSKPVTVNHTLTLTAGVLLTTATNLLTLANGSTISGGSTTSYVDGPIKKIGTTAFTFHVGNLSRYARLVMTPVSGYDATSAFTCSYTKSAAVNNTNTSYMGTGIHHVSGIEYWDLARTTDPLNDASCNVTLYYDNAVSSGITDGTELRVAHYNVNLVPTPKWEDHGGTGTGTLITSTTPITSFSPITFGSHANYPVNPLPIELLRFDAKMNANKQVDILWTTATEVNNDYFTVERSANTNDFNAIATVNGSGNSSRKINYSTIDPNPLAGISYYRLKQTDFDGRSTHSSIVAIENLLRSAMFFIFPNPADAGTTSHLNFNVNETKEILVVVYNAEGKEVFSKVTIVERGNGQVVAIDSSNMLPPGIYVISATSDNSIYRQKLIIK
jgi:hypothetical protein